MRAATDATDARGREGPQGTAARHYCEGLLRRGSAVTWEEWAEGEGGGGAPRPRSRAEQQSRAEQRSRAHPAAGAALAAGAAPPG